MTLSELLDCDAAKLESFTDEQLLEWFKPMLCVTRPELAAQHNPQKKLYKQGKLVEYNQSVDYKVKAALAMKFAKDMGIDLKL